MVKKIDKKSINESQNIDESKKISSIADEKEVATSSQVDKPIEENIIVHEEENSQKKEESIASASVLENQQATTKDNAKPQPSDTSPAKELKAKNNESDPQVTTKKVSKHIAGVQKLQTLFAKVLLGVKVLVLCVVLVGSYYVADNMYYKFTGNFLGSTEFIREKIFANNEIEEDDVDSNAIGILEVNEDGYDEDGYENEYEYNDGFQDVVDNEQGQNNYLQENEDFIIEDINDDSFDDIGINDDGFIIEEDNDVNNLVNATADFYGQITGNEDEEEDDVVQTTQEPIEQTDQIEHSILSVEEKNNDTQVSDQEVSDQAVIPSNEKGLEKSNLLLKKYEEDILHEQKKVQLLSYLHMIKTNLENYQPYDLYAIKALNVQYKNEKVHRVFKELYAYSKISFHPDKFFERYQVLLNDAMHDYYMNLYPGIRGRVQSFIASKFLILKTNFREDDLKGNQSYYLYKLGQAVKIGNYREATQIIENSLQGEFIIAFADYLDDLKLYNRLVNGINFVYRTFNMEVGEVNKECQRICDKDRCKMVCKRIF